MYLFVITFRELASIIAGFNRIWTPIPPKYAKQAEAEVVPSSSLVEVDVEIEVEVGLRLRLGLGVS